MTIVPPPPTTTMATSTSTAATSSFMSSIEETTAAFSRTIQLNNAGAARIERGDYHAAIKALTASFLSFKKAYNQQKQSLPCLRMCLQQQEQQQQRQRLQEQPQEHCDRETVSFNVDGLFSWKTRTIESFHDSSSSSSSSWNEDRELSSHANESSADMNSMPSPFFHPCSGSSTSSTSSVPQTKKERKRPYYQDQHPEEVASVYSNPIHLPPDFPVTLESCGFLSTAITINLAMANHLCGLELLKRSSPSSNSTAQYLVNAGRYYEYTIRLERARQQEEHARMVASAANATAHGWYNFRLLPPLFVSPIALLVILNNLGQLHAAMQNPDRAQKCYRQLQSTLFFLLLHRSNTNINDNDNHNHQGSSRNDISHSVQQRNDLQVFMENATLGLQTASSRPPAAAA